MTRCSPGMGKIVLENFCASLRLEKNRGKKCTRHKSSAETICSRLWKKGKMLRENLRNLEKWKSASSWHHHRHDDSHCQFLFNFISSRFFAFVARYNGKCIYAGLKTTPTRCKLFGQLCVKNCTALFEKLFLWCREGNFASLDGVWRKSSGITMLYR